MQGLRNEGKRAPARFFCSPLPPIRLRESRPALDKTTASIRAPLQSMASFLGSFGAYDWERPSSSERFRLIAATVVIVGLAGISILLFLP